jgi:Bacterial pre-peptidase C-terminal domain
MVRSARSSFLVCSMVLGMAMAAAGAAARAVAPAEPCPPDPLLTLRPGLPIQKLSSNFCRPGINFRLRVPVGTLHLTFASRGGLGNANLFAKFGSPATDAEILASVGPTNLETIEVANPQAGVWFVRLQADNRFVGVSVLAEIAVDETVFEVTTPPTGIADTTPGRFRFFSFEVPDGTARIDIETDGGGGNADLYAQPETVPTEESFTVVSAGATNKEKVSIPSPQGGPWKVATYSSTAYSGVNLDVTIVPGGSCGADETTLCLQNNRVSVAVDWINQHAGNQPGVGHAVVGTQETGTFWFFDSDNTELVIKVLDGRALNGKFWFFWGGLTDLEYTITVTDTETGTVRSFVHPAGSTSGGFDTNLF